MQQVNRSVQKMKDLLLFLWQGAVRAVREPSTTGKGEIPKQKKEGPWQVWGKGRDLSISALKVLKRGKLSGVGTRLTPRPCAILHPHIIMSR